MPDPPRQATEVPAGPGTADAGVVARPTPEPWFQVDTFGERVGVGAMVLMSLGGVLAWGDVPLWSWGPIAISGLSLVPLTLGILALLQVVSTASLLSNVIVLGIGWMCGAAAVLSRLSAALGAGEPVGPGVVITAIGVLGGIAAMDLNRREAHADYVAMATRAMELALQPRVQISLIKLLIPFALAGGISFFILEVWGQQVANKMVLIFISYFFNPLGKEVAIPLALSEAGGPSLDPMLTWSFIVAIDGITALFLVWNWDHVLKVPYIGRMFAWIERRGNATVIKYKWIGRLAFFGLTFYATLPLEGTGAIGGSVVGRAIGLAAVPTFFAVLLGSVIRTSLTTLIVMGALSALGL